MGTPRKPRYSREVETAKFWNRVNKGAPNGCWEWTAGCGSHGRGLHAWGGRQTLAYRVSWELHHGAPPPSHLHICHHCDNPLCVNPAHLFLGTDLDNYRDARRKGRTSPPPRHEGEAHPLVRAADEVVAEARHAFASGRESAEAIAKRTGHARTTVLSWLHGETRLAAGGPIAPALVRDSSACINGHEWTPENTGWTNVKGHMRRRCRACNRIRAAIKRGSLPANALTDHKGRNGNKWSTVYRLTNQQEWTP